MYIACVTGMVGAVGLGIFGFFRLDLLFIVLAASCFLYCRSKLTLLKETGPESEYGGDVIDYSASLRPDGPAKKRRRASRWTVRRCLRRAGQARDAAEQQTIDAILAKVSGRAGDAHADMVRTPGAEARDGPAAKARSGIVAEGIAACAEIRMTKSE